jgi:23S rRNA pseudouridine1911/1915/1917 synthase
VPHDASGRLDRYLAVRLPMLSRSRIQQLLAAGSVRRDGLPITDASAPVQPGASYAVEEPDPAPAEPAAQAMELAILYEDADLIVLDKPAGLVVHPAPGSPDRTLVNALLAHCGNDLMGIGGERRPGIVHRLDKDTSGVMVVAKTEPAHVALSAAFARRDLDRAYVVLCWGLPASAEGEFTGPIGRDPRDRKRMAVVARGGKQALTRYRLLRGFGTGASLLECRLATGRTHQIRVHLSTAGHPVVGDPLYLRRRPAAARALPQGVAHRLLDFPRQALHAARLGFRHPVTGHALSFETPMPADMQALVDGLTGP